MPVFVDTNIVVYAFSGDASRAGKAESILEGQPTISVQVVNEFLSVCRVKLRLDTATRHRLATELLAGCNVVALDMLVVAKAMEIEANVNISWWDALIVAAALLSGCDTLYTEDLQHSQVFEGQLKVVNPYA